MEVDGTNIDPIGSGNEPAETENDQTEHGEIEMELAAMFSDPLPCTPPVLSQLGLAMKRPSKYHLHTQKKKQINET